MIRNAFVTSDVHIDGGGHISFSVGLGERGDSRDFASVTILFERPGEYHADHHEEEVAVDPRIAVEVCLTYCLDSLTSAFAGNVPEDVFEAMTVVQATVRGTCDKWCEMEED